MNGRRTYLTIAVSALVLVAVGCSASSSDDSATTTAFTPKTTTTIAALETTTTTQAATTTAPLSELEKLGYPVSDRYTVETVIVDLDSATGGLAIDKDGVMYQADFGYTGHPGNSVYRIDVDGTVETYSTSDAMSSLTMTIFGPDGLIYQSSYGSGKVFVIDGNGDAEVYAEGFRGPTGLAFLEDGTLVVEAYDSDKIHKVAPDGTVTEWVTDPHFNGINGLAQGPDGMLYVADHRDGAIFSVSPDGAVVELHRFPKETSHVAYRDGSLFVTSRGAYVVFRYDLASGDVEIIAGDGSAGTQDGPGGVSSIGRPNAIVVSPADGELYINHGGDGTNQPLSIRRIIANP